jgi:hypothetical protein
MPPTALNEAGVAAAELEKVRDKLEVIYESDDHFYANIKKRDVEIVSYREMRVPQELAPGGAFQYFNPDGGDLGRGGAPTIDKATVRPVFLSENIEYTKLAQWSTDDRRKAIINSVRRLTARGIVELRRQLDAQLQQAGTGQVGIISAVSTAGGVDTYTLGTDGFGARLVRKGQVVQVYDTTLATFRGKGTITKWDVENKQIDVTPAVAGAIATDILITDGLTTPTSLPALYGVPYHHSNASTGTWLGYNRANFPEIRANRVNAGSLALSLPLPRLAINKIGNRVGIDNKFKCTAWHHPAQAQAYEEIGQAVVMLQKTTKEEGLNLYFGDNMQFAGAPGRQHFNWDKTRIDFIVDSVWGRAEILPIGFYQTDGRQIFEIRGASGGVATADIFYMVVGMQTFVTNPAACAYIDALAVPSGY